jgi:hypothetical protein
MFHQEYCKYGSIPVINSFTSFQGRFVKSLPLHPSQEIIKDDEEEDRLIIQLNVYPTFGLVMQILSYGKMWR